MKLSTEYIIALNQKIPGADSGNGTFQSNRRNNLESSLGNCSDLTLDNLASLATQIVCDQMFAGGNHRTAMLLIYMGLLDMGISLSTPAYELYAVLDHARATSAGRAVSSKKPGELVREFLQGQQSQMIVVKHYVERYRNKKLGQVLGVPATLARCVSTTNGGAKHNAKTTKHPRFEPGYKSIRKRFQELHGGTLQQYF